MATQFSVAAPLRIPYATHQRLSGGLVSLIPEQIIGLVPCQPLPQNECRPLITECIKVLAGDGTVERENDRSSFLFQFPLSTGTNNSFRLQKWNGITWANVATLNNNTLGTFFNFGSLPPYVRYSGFILNWYLIKLAHGLGTYRFVVLDTVLNDTKNDSYSYPFVLQNFNCETADATFKIETVFKGEISNRLKEPYDSRIALFDLVNLANGWYDSCRYYGGIGRVNYTKEQTYVRLADGSNRLVYTDNSDSHEAEIIRSTEDLLNRLSWYGLQSSEIYLTDYNKTAKYFYEKTAVVLDNETAPKNYNRQMKQWQYAFRFKKYTNMRFQKGGFI